MKSAHLIIPSIAFWVTLQGASGAISISASAGEFLTSTGSLAPENSLWAIVYDANGDNVLPGGLGLNSNLTVSNVAQIQASFNGATIATGNTIGLDKILWAGEIDGFNTSGVAGVGQHIFNNVTFSGLGVAGNGNWAVYWFPSLTTSSNTLSGSFQVGGLQTTIAGSGGDLGMAFPSDDTTGFSFTAAFINEAQEGDIPNSSFTAVAIPESSSLALSALGLGALLRRRRK